MCKKHPDALLAKTMHGDMTLAAESEVKNNSFFSASFHKGCDRYETSGYVGERGKG